MLVLILAAALAQTTSVPGVQLQDEGTSQGQVTKVNCVGTTVACTKSGATGTITVTGGVGSANTASATVDFGSTGQTNASVVVTGQAWVTITSIIVCAPTLLAGTSRTEGQEDAVIEGLTVSISTRVAATGFTVDAAIREGTAIGTFVIHCTGA